MHSRRRRRRKPKRLLPNIITFAVLAIGIFIFAIASSGAGGYPSTEADSSRPPAGASAAIAPEGFPDFTAQVQTTALTDTQYLKLVNRSLPIAAPVNYAQLTSLWPDISVRATYVTLRETAFLAMRDLFAEANHAGHGNLFVASGFRSQEEQSHLYTNALDRAYVMPPGHSEHQLGLAADILAGADTPTMRGSEEARWLAENAPQFGFILRYPEDKQDITGTPYEPWHFRYVGRVHAWYMGKQNFVLEEYIDYLRRHGGYRAEFGGRT